MRNTTDKNLFSHSSPTDICVHRVLDTRASAEGRGGIPSALVPLVRPVLSLGYPNSQSPPSYTSDDPIGVELAGAMKNVYAIVTVSFSW